MQKHWHQRQLRILQTVLREPDAKGYDAKAVASYMEESGSNAIVVNAGGIIDFFQAKGPLRRINVFLQEQDILGDLTYECHKRGMAVMARVDFRGVEKERYEQSPDWFALDQEKGPRVGYEGRIHKPCYAGMYAGENAAKYIRGLMEEYPIDGIWENSVGFGDGICYCKTCRDRYMADAGRLIPNEGAGREEIQAYRAWKAGVAAGHLRLMRDTVKSFGDDKAYCAEIFGMFHASGAIGTGIDLYNAKDLFDFLATPAFLDGPASGKRYDELSQAASSMRFLRSISPSKEIVLLCGNNGTKFRYVKAPTVETKIWMWEAAAVGAGFWNCMFNGQHPGATFDRRNALIEKPVYEFLKSSESALSGQAPVMDVAIFFSKPSRDLFGSDDESKDGYGVFIKGLERVLVSSHIQYGFVCDLDFSMEKLAGVKVLALPN
ncbi:MAG: hypothetical protein LBT59_00935, partial [Clostridiales bacterium]|nr:hypothetical protein [Clostridiales bacterium]